MSWLGSRKNAHLVGWIIISRSYRDSSIRRAVKVDSFHFIDKEGPKRVGHRIDCLDPTEPRTNFGRLNEVTSKQQDSVEYYRQSLLSYEDGWREDCQDSKK